MKKNLNERAKELGYDDCNGLIETYEEDGYIHRGIKDKTKLKGMTDKEFHAVIEALVPDGNGSTAMRAAAYQGLKEFL